MSGPASSEDCPCCHTPPVRLGIDTDRALVLAFFAGVTARDQGVPLGEALCVSHGVLLADAIGFIADNMPKPGSTVQ